MEIIRASFTGFAKSARLIAGVFFILTGLGGCALLVPQTAQLGETWPLGLPERVELGEVPFFPQQDYQCGPAALATSLAAFNVKVTPEDLVEQVYLPARQGSLQIEMLAAPRRYDMVSYQLAPRFEDVLREVAAGVPVIVLQDYGVWPVSIWHYAVVAGYDRLENQLVLRSGEKKSLIIPFSIFEYTWKESSYWAMVTVPPDRIPVTATESGYLASIMAMQRVGSPQATQIAYATFLGRWPDNLAASIGLANSYHALGKLNDAEAVLRRAAERQPDSVVVLNNLAQMLSDQGRNDEALRLIERAAGMPSPFSAAVTETHQLILQRLGKGK